MLAVTIMGTYVTGSYFRSVGNYDDNQWALQQVYTHDESDI